MRREELQHNFGLTPELVEEVLSPRSAGGGDGFKVLALYGDLVFDLLLLELLEEEHPDWNSGELTRYIGSVTNHRTLLKLGLFLKLDELIGGPEFSPPENDIKECVEAVVGAAYLVGGLPRARRVVEYLVRKVEEEDLRDTNPKGELLEYIRKVMSKGGGDTTLPSFDDTVKVGGEDHAPLFRCRLHFLFKGEEISVESELFSSKKSAQRDAAEKALTKIKR